MDHLGIAEDLALELKWKRSEKNFCTFRFLLITWLSSREESLTAPPSINTSKRKKGKRKKEKEKKKIK